MPQYEPYEIRWFDGQRRRNDSFPKWGSALDDQRLERWLTATELTFVSAAQWQWEEGRRIPRRRLPTSTMAWIHRGQGTMRVAGETHRLVPPCLQFVPAGQWHDVHHDPGQPLGSIGVHFHAAIPAAGELIALLGFPRILPIAPLGDDAPVVAALRQLARLDAVRPPGWRLLAQAELTRALMHVLLHHGPAFPPAAPTPPRDAGRLGPALALIERELERGPIAVSALAAAAGISAVHLRTLFRRATGQSPHRYVQGRRIARACRLLHQGEAGIASIAQAVGVASPRAFFRLFRNLTGTSPQRWRTAPLD